jgi:hypothetical protein
MGQHDQLLLKIALEKGIVKAPQVKKALDLHSSQTFKQHLGEKPKAIDQILLERGFINQRQLTQLREAVQKHLLDELAAAGEQIRRCSRCRVRYIGPPPELAQVQTCPVCTQPTEPESAPESFEGLVKAPYAQALKGLDLQTRAALGNNGTIARRYLKVHRAGSNETAEVWKCRDLATRDPVTVKLFRLTPPSEVLARFKLQQDRLQAVRHPFIAGVLETGTDQGQIYVVSEHAEGMPLSEIQQLEPDRLLDVFGMVCEGMQHAHDQGVFHLNLKPSNIIVDKDGNPKLVDFGTMRQTTVTTGAATQTIYGTIPYLSPEQVAGQVKEWDGLTDVYALGATLYFALTGKPPFENVEMGDLIRAVMQGQPKEPRLVNPEIPEDCQRIVKRAMAKLKPFRYPKPITMAKDIRQYLEGKGLRDSYTVMNVKLTDVLEESKKITATVGPPSQSRIVSPLSPKPVLEGFLWLFALPGLLLVSAAGLLALGAHRLSNVMVVSITFDGPRALFVGAAAAALSTYSIYFLIRRMRSRGFFRASAWAFLAAGLGTGMLGALAGMVALMSRRVPRLGIVRVLAAALLGVVYVTAFAMTLMRLAEDGSLSRDDLGILGIGSLIVLIGSGALLAFTPNRSPVKLPGLAGALWAVGIGLATGVGWIAFLKGFEAPELEFGPKLTPTASEGSRPPATRELRGVSVRGGPGLEAVAAAAKEAGLDFVAAPRTAAPFPKTGAKVISWEPAGSGGAPEPAQSLALCFRSLMIGTLNPELWWTPWAPHLAPRGGPVAAEPSIVLGPVVIDLRRTLSAGAVVRVQVTATRTLEEAFRERRTFTAWEGFGDPSGFSFHGMGFGIGDRSPMVPEDLVVRLPREGLAVLTRDGRPVGHAEGSSMTFQASEPGSYSVVAYARLGGRWVPWIASGPIYVGKQP